MNPIPPPPDILEQLWQALADSSARNHWHGGPEPCPVCGGTPTVHGPKPVDVQARLKELRHHSKETR
jgi:hypothetical protein